MRAMHSQTTPDRRYTHIFLYHATFTQVPDELSEGLHNVAPDELYRQVRFMLEYFDCVSVDALLGEENVEGKFAITFDDAYQCVMDESVERLLDLGVPFTVFVNTCTLLGRPFWRDKVRLLMSRGLVKDFLDRLPNNHGLKGLDAKRFYRASKTPEMNSQDVNTALDEYFACRGIALPGAAHCVQHPESLMRHELISYGNHSHSHYVLSSLAEAQQRQEIDTAREMLQELDLHQSRIFSIPFGEPKDFTPATVDLLRELGYEGFVYSRDRLHKEWHESAHAATSEEKDENSLSALGLKGLERYKVPETLEGLQRHIRRLEHDATSST
jgi:peptidoglycan/xylan/chitin deacetylase (PgdA/CDA1 family)